MLAGNVEIGGRGGSVKKKIYIHIDIYIYTYIYKRLPLYAYRRVS